jgi:hypothetical protein
VLDVDDGGWDEESDDDVDEQRDEDNDAGHHKVSKCTFIFVIDFILLFLQPKAMFCIFENVFKASPS